MHGRPDRRSPVPPIGWGSTVEGKNEDMGGFDVMNGAGGSHREETSYQGAWLPEGRQTLTSVVLCTTGLNINLDRAVKSILDQSWQRLELVVVDNRPLTGNARDVVAVPLAKTSDNTSVTLPSGPKRTSQP